MGDTARTIAALMEAEIEIVTDAIRLRPEASEVERLWADNAKARRLLDWAPAYGGAEGFRRGLGETIAWFRDPVNLSSYKANLYNL